jgi:plasmid stabilization system protein ParE
MRSKSVVFNIAGPPPYEIAPVTGMLNSARNLGSSKSRPAMAGFPADRYIIVYRVSDRDVLILRVAHSNRDIEALFGH